MGGLGFGTLTRGGLRIEEDCRSRIKQARSFWIDKIYKESTRPGKILKMAMQGPSYRPK